MNVRNLLKKHEGLMLRPYKCPAGHWSIGYGHNLEAHGEFLPESITEEEAEEYLTKDIEKAIDDCQMQIPDFEGYDSVRKAVLIDMCYNMGVWKLIKFVRMLKAMHQYDWQRAADELLDSKYARQVGSRSKENAQMLITGLWPHEI